MPRNTTDISLLLYSTLGLCVTGCIFGLLIYNPHPQNLGQNATPSPKPSVSPSVQSPPPCQKLDNQTICQSLADVPDVPNMKVKFAGAATFPPLNKLLLDKIQKVHPQFVLDYYYSSSPTDIPSSDTAVKWLIEGTQGNLSFVQTSQTMKQEAYKLAQARGFKLQQVPIASNLYAIYVNTQLTPQLLQGLTIKQVRDIFTGQVRNWQELGGPNLPIFPFRLTKQTLGQGKLTSDFFQDQVMLGQPYGTNTKDILIPSEGIRAVGTTPGSISFITASQVVKQNTIRILPIANNNNPPFVSPCADNTCETVDKQIIGKNYPKELTGNLYIVIKDDGSLDKRAGIAYTNMLLSDEGQKLVEKAGFIPIRIIP